MLCITMVAGIKIEVDGLDEETISQIGAEVTAAGGLLVASGAGGDYALVPLDWDSTSHIEHITVLWIVSTPYFLQGSDFRGSLY